MDEKSLSAKNIFGHNARLYADKYWQLPFFEGLLSRFAKAQNFGASILDLGCGPGNISSILLTKRDDLLLEGWDFAPEMIDEARLRVPNARFQVKNVLELNEYQQSFNGIVCGFCAPYLPKQELVQLIAEMSKRLYSGGLLYFSTMIAKESDEFWMKPKVEGGDQLFVNIHQEAELKGFFEKQGFVLVDEIHIELEGDAGEEDWAVIYQKNRSN